MRLLQILERVDREAQFSNREYEHDAEEDSGEVVSEPAFEKAQSLESSYGMPQVKFSPFFDLVDWVFLAGRDDLLLPNMLAVLCLNCFV
jgi:hypothetical protein